MMSLEEMDTHEEPEVDLCMLEAKAEDEGRTPSENKDYEPGEMESDLCEAHELLQAALITLDGISRTLGGGLVRRRGLNLTQEKEIEDLASEITVYLDQWEF